MEQLKDRYRTFKEWQHAAPHYANRHEGEVQHCHNCGHEFYEDGDGALQNIVIVSAGAVLLSSVILYIVHLINKHGKK